MPRYFPLTGLLANAESASRLNNGAVVVKIENSPQSRPQGGLDVADVVYEPVVEGGQTRFLAVFQSTDAEQVGPVRSVRPNDPAIVSPFGGVVAYSGGIGRFVDAMKATGLKNYTEDDKDVLVRRSGRPAPHNLYTSTSALRAKAGNPSPPPKFNEFLNPGDSFAPAGAVPVTHIDLRMGRTTDVDYDWDATSGTWKRATDGRAHLAESGAQLAAHNLIVQFIPYEGTGEVDAAGSPVAEGKVVGTGDATIFANGLMLSARWSKPNASAMTTYTDLNGVPISLPPGRTWIAMPAIGASLSAV